MNRYKENMININISKSEVITFFFSDRKLIENSNFRGCLDCRRICNSTSFVSVGFR